MKLRHHAANLLLAVALCIPSTAPAGEIDQIAHARRLLADASTELRAARSDESRLAALGHAVTAHEAALSALRTGLRAMATTERGMTGEIDTETGKLRSLLGALLSLSRAPTSTLLAARGGPLEATRAAMLMAGVTPELDRRVTALEQRLHALQDLRKRQEEARTEVRNALANLQELRAKTTETLGQRDRSGQVDGSELRLQANVAAARVRDLDDLAAALHGADIKSDISLSFAPLPVAGQVSAKFGAPDPWGRPGHGWSIVAPDFAQVTAPWDATVRYAGPLIDYGQVVVLEPEAGYLVVIAGLGHIDRSAGEVVLAGEKLGDMGGQPPTSDEFLLDQTVEGGQIRQETLYLEIRRSGEPLDPADWFDATGSEAIR